MIRPHETCSLYPIELPLTYTTSNWERISGHGRSVAVGSQIVRFECDRELPVNCKIQLTLPWPATLPDGTRLSLWIFGDTTRSSGRELTMRVIKYDFRTRRAAQPAPSASASKSLQEALARVVRVGA
jgi:hypothetical protein